MSHIHTDPGQHDLTSSALIFRIDGRVPRIFLHMHKKLHTWMHVGGHVELHETPWAAVIREIREESGYDLNQLRLLQPPQAIKELKDDLAIAHPQPFLFATYPYDDGKMKEHYHTDTCFLFVTREDPRHPVGESESDTIRLFTKNELAALPPEQIYRNLQIAALYAFEKILNEWRDVDPMTYSTASPGH